MKVETIYRSIHAQYLWVKKDAHFGRPIPVLITKALINWKGANL